MKRQIVTLLIFASLFSATTVYAASKYAVIEEKCRAENAPEFNNSVVMGCADLASGAVKRDMNIIYQKIYKILESRGPLAAEHFEQAQRSWLDYRENTCDLQSLVIGTPMYSVCRLDMNVDRLSELRRFLVDIH